MDTQSPHDRYRDMFYDLLIRNAPRSILDVGCGEGGLLKRLKRDGIAGRGVEIDESTVADAKARDLDVTLGTAEAIPFKDGTVDWAVCEFSAHHFTDIRKAVAEFLRVARSGIAFLDQWYDETMPSQRVARDFDRWCKKIDRRSGMVHHDTFEPGALVRIIREQEPGAEILSCTYDTARPLPRDRFEIDAGEHLDITGGDPDMRDELDAIRREAKTLGIACDACFIVLARKNT